MDALSSTPTNSSRAPARVFLQLQRHAGNRAVVEQLMKAPRPAGSGAVTGLPSALRRQAEGLSGVDLSDVRVHNHSAAPAALGAAAFTRGNDIFLGHEGDRHLAHEAWHVVQQREGRVPATAQVLGLSANDNPDLEHEADDASREMPSLRDKDVVLRRAGGHQLPMSSRVCSFTNPARISKSLTVGWTPIPAPYMNLSPGTMRASPRSSRWSSNRHKHSCCV